MYELDPVHFLSAPELAWQASLKKDRSRIRIINWYWMLLMVKKGIIGGIYHTIHRYATANKK